MPDQFGSTFQPDDSHLPPWMRRGQQGAATPVQQAIQILSLRLPHVFGAQAPLSAELAMGANLAQLVGTLARPSRHRGRDDPMVPPADAAGVVPPAHQRRLSAAITSLTSAPRADHRHGCVPPTTSYLTQVQ
jgi:hypothetical protein